MCLFIVCQNLLHGIRRGHVRGGAAPRAALEGYFDQEAVVRFFKTNYYVSLQSVTVDIFFNHHLRSYWFGCEFQEISSSDDELEQEKRQPFKKKQKQKGIKKVEESVDENEKVEMKITRTKKQSGRKSFEFRNANSGKTAVRGICLSMSNVS